MIPNKYEFSVPTKIIFGSGVIKEAGSKAKELNAKKILIVAGENVRKAGLTKDVETSLTAVGIPYVYFSEFVPNPRDYTCNKGYEFAKKEKVDTVIAVGGGSAMDTAKAIATLLTNGGDVLDWCGADLLKTDMAPLIAIPTTAGTGSEVTPFAVVTDSKTQTKLNILDMRVTPKYALVDPHVLLNLPPHIMAATGIDAMTHAVEAYTCTVANPHTDVYALYAIRLISSNLFHIYYSSAISKFSFSFYGYIIVFFLDYCRLYDSCYCQCIVYNSTFKTFTFYTKLGIRI